MSICRYKRCGTLLSYFSKCQNPSAHASFYCQLAIIRNSPCTDQTNLNYLNICYTALFLSPDNVVSFRKTVSTIGGGDGGGHDPPTFLGHCLPEKIEIL